MFPTYEEFIKDMESNNENLVKHNIPKNKKTKQPIFKHKKRNGGAYEGPDFYLLNRVKNNKFLKKFLI